MITFQVKDSFEEIQTIEVPEGISLSLMEVLKASDYPIEATCGGMALCATCHIAVARGAGQIAAPLEHELDMLDTLPNSNDESRLACQIRIDKTLEGALFVLRATAD
ncbi:MAG: 2Fe-2S iron-sulfur cluster-binding protein [Chryseolinea sp.]